MPGLRLRLRVSLYYYLILSTLLLGSKLNTRYSTTVLTTVRAVRNQLSTIESTFKLPTVLDFDESMLAGSPNNAPLRAYENTPNGLLEQLDAIESDCDEEVRNVRRKVVKEMEKTLEDLERRVSEKAAKRQVTMHIEVKGV